MTTQRLISDARRRAKQLARASGRPHQNHLDEIAVEAGRADWAAFLADPAVIPDAPVDGPRSEHLKPDHEIERRIDALVSFWTLPGVIGAIVLVGVLMMSRTRFPLYGPIADHVTASAMALTFVVMVAMFALCMPALMVAVGGLAMTFPGKHEPHLERPMLVRLWKRIGMRLIAAFLAPVAFLTLFPAIMYSVPLEDISSHERDAAVERRVQIEGMDRPWVLSSSGRRLPEGQEIAVVAIDQRISPPQLRAEIPDERFGPEIADTFRDHAVLRLRGIVDCDTGRLSVQRIETTDSVTGPAIASAPHRRRGGKGFTFDKQSVATICHPSGSTV